MGENRAHADDNVVLPAAPSSRTVVQALLFAACASTLLAILLRVAHAGDVPLFMVSATALVPLAWLVGHATDQAAEHTGPGVGGFLNASFGNAPELIISVFALANSLPDVVRGSLTGSVVGNLLLVLGFALFAGGDGRLDRRSLLGNLALITVAAVLFLIPSVRGWHGNPERHSLALVTLPIAIALLTLYVVVTTIGLRRHRRLHLETKAEPHAICWSLPFALTGLGLATAATAIVSGILVHALVGFGKAAGLPQFFVSAVIVAIVGNAAEHGGAVLIAFRGKIDLASEIAVSSSAQVALLVIPAIALLSWAVRPTLPFSFRPIELTALGGSASIVALAVADGRSRRWRGGLLIALYGAIVVAFFAVGDR